MAADTSSQKRPMDESTNEDSPKEPTSKRARRIRPQLRSGYDCILVDELPDHLRIECSICLCVLEDPQLIDCKCGAHFCKACIAKIKDEKKPCPLCKGKFATLVSDRHLQRTINSLRVYCSFKEAGCGWVGELKVLSGEHLNSDPSNNYKKEGCPYVPLECSHCKETFQRRNILDHENKTCSKRPTTCDICGEYESTFEDVTKNHVPLCPSQLVPCSKLCGKSVPQNSLDKHLENDCPLQVTECLYSYAGCDMRLLRKDMNAHISESLAHHLCLQAVSHKQLLDKKTSMQKEIDDLKKKLDEKVPALQDELEYVRSDVTDLGSKQELLHTHMSIVPVHFVVNNFVAKRKAGEIWYSRPFYTHARGYKMCLKVYTNGHGNGQNSHISVYVKILSGEFDYKLDWPFQGSVYIQVVDQGEEMEHWSNRIVFDDEMIPGSSPPVKKGQKNTEWGLDMFFPQELLSSGFYKVENDSILFEVTDISNSDSCCIM